MSKRLEVYPKKVALLLVSISLFLYLFFLIWPISYSVFIAFTNANAINIASDPKINELKSKLQNLESYLTKNKEFIISKASEAENYLNATKLELNLLYNYINNATSKSFSITKFDNYKQNINSNLTNAINIIISNNTNLYYYTDLRNNLDIVFNQIQKVWSDIDNVIGFKLTYTDEDLNKIKGIINNNQANIQSYLTKSIDDLRDIRSNYDNFIKIATADILNQIDSISLKFVGMDNFYTLFKDSRFPYSIFKTLLFILTSVPLKISVGLLLAFIFSSTMIYGRKVMRALLLIPWALPVLLSITTWRMLFVPGQGFYAQIFSGISNYDFNIYLHEWDAFLVYNLVETWLAYPFVMTVTMGAIASVPKEYIEAAYIDGGNVFTRFRKIMLPLISRPVLFAAILTTGASIQAFMVPLLINNGGPTALLSFLNFPTALGNTNEVIILYGYNRAWLDQQYGLSTASFLIAVLILLVFAIIWFYFVYKRSFSR
jgi:arabinogalactan oligomer/maltooligosaccharide transport system permease protein